jgi:hypothetical protein
LEFANVSTEDCLVKSENGAPGEALA